MIDGIPLVDVHVHAVRVPTLKLPWDVWAPPAVSAVDHAALHHDDGRVDPAALHAHLDDEGVDVALLMAEYSPRVTGIQAAEDMLPLVAHDPTRVGFIAALNPHYHFPLVAELERQVGLGAVALKLHPVHGGYPANRSDLYPVYARCEESGLPVVVHCGTSNFPGASNIHADPAPLTDVVRDFPALRLVLAHGGRGWSYDAAAFLALAYEHVWIELSGLPPQRLPEYYAGVGFERLARKCIFGTDWPAVPGARANAKRLSDLGLPRPVLEGVLWRNAVAVYGLGEHPHLAARLPAT
jgi:uncharacterized protein